MIHIANLHKTYKLPFWEGKGGKAVCQGVNFDAKPGQITGLIGANGVGKTTIFRIICGMLEFDQGEVVVDGLHLPEQMTQLRGRVNMMFEQHHFHAPTGMACLIETGILMGMSEKDARERAKLICDEHDLGEFIFAKPMSYSRGQKGRMAVARMMMDPVPVMIFDEPTVGLDFQSARLIRQRLKDLARAGHTVVLATHILADIENMCDVVVGIRDGQTVDEMAVRGWIDEAKRLERQAPVAVEQVLDQDQINQGDQA